VPEIVLENAAVVIDGLIIASLTRVQFRPLIWSVSGSLVYLDLQEATQLNSTQLKFICKEHISTKI